MSDADPSQRTTPVLYYFVAAAAIGAYSVVWATADKKFVGAANIILIVGTIALVMRWGFAWVSKAAQADPTSPTVVATRSDEMQAASVVAVLVDNGINATVVGSFTAAFQVEIGSPVKIVVPQNQVPQAQTILDAMGDQS